MGSRLNSSESVEWGCHAALAMCDEARSFPIPIGDGTLTLGNLFDKTPKDLISKVMLEEKVFKTWHSGRIALLGDGKHMLFYNCSWLFFLNEHMFSCVSE
jgi:hypothetical protein